MRALFLALALSLVSTAAAQPELVDTRPRVNDTQLRHALDGLRVRHAVPGMSVALFDREGVRVLAVGEQTPGGSPVTPSTRFRAAQVSLLFNALAVATLVADGSLPADAELRRLAAEVDLHNPWSGERPVRVEDLLAHQAGLGATHFRDVYAADAGQPLLAGINRAFRALRVNTRPGEHAAYSIVGPSITAYLAEKAAGMPYETILERLLIQPLGLGASLGRPSGPEREDSAGHVGWPARATADLPLNLPVAGDIWTSAEDLGRVGQVVLREGQWGERQVLQPAAIAWMEARPGDPGQVVLPAFSRGLLSEEVGGLVFHGLVGALPGFLARFAYSRELGRGYVILLNHGGARQALADVERLLQGQLLAAVTPPLPEPPRAAGETDLAGWYRDASPELAPRAFHQAWLGFAKVTACEPGWCLSGPGERRRFAWFDATRLRETGRWYPSWEVEAGEEGLAINGHAARWERIDSVQRFLPLLLAFIVMGGLAAAAVALPAWIVGMGRRQLRHYHELLPRLLPLAAVLAFAAFQWLLFATGYPALGVVSIPSVAILVGSILAPLLAVLAIPAFIAGIAWKLPWRALVLSGTQALAACVASGAMWRYGLVAFQTWNY